MSLRRSSCVFQSTLPARGATILVSGGCALRTDFNPRSPHGERREIINNCTFETIKISIHAPRTGSDWLWSATLADLALISIHAPRTGSDAREMPLIVLYMVFQSTLPARGATHLKQRVEDLQAISIHAPRTGSDGFCCSLTSKASEFQSTLPARGATWQSLRLPRRPVFQSTLPARGATTFFCLLPPRENISIHAPRTGSDYALISPARIVLLFQSTLPARGATKPSIASTPSPSNFNPRSPHGERRGRIPTLYAPANFNPRSPHGERQWDKQNTKLVSIFQSTLPARGATQSSTGRQTKTIISIHAPRTGSDPPTPPKHLPPSSFQSTLPARGATGWRWTYFSAAHLFQSTLPARGATSPCPCA